jgi:drug/metabolite transporter (DMT)-like permease
MTYQQIGNLLLLSLLWGGSFLFIGIAVQEIDPLLLVFLRVVIAAVVMLSLLPFFKVQLPREVDIWKKFFVMGFLNNVIPFTFIFYAQTLISVSLASIINAMTPICTFIVLALFKEELLKPNKVIGSLLGVLGVTLLSGLTQLALHTDPMGVLFSFLATVSYGFSGLWAKRHLTGRNSIQSAASQLTASTLIMIPVLLMTSTELPNTLPSFGVMASILALSVASTAFAYILFFELISKAGAANAMLVTLLVPISGTLLGISVLNETITLIQVMGGLFIGLGLLIIDGRLFNPLQKR